MKKIYLIPLFMYVVFNSNIFADGKTRGEFPIQAQFLSGNNGGGPSVGYNFTDVIYVGGDFLSAEKTYGEGTVTGSATFLTNLVTARFSPWDDSGFYLQAGAGNADWNMTISGPGYIGTSSIEYSNKMDINIKWGGSATMAGLGWNWIGDSGFSGGLGLQSIGLGEPEITVTDTEGEASSTEIAEEETYWKSVFGSWSSAGNLYVNFGWNF